MKYKLIASILRRFGAIFDRKIYARFPCFVRFDSMCSRSPGPDLRVQQLAEWKLAVAGPVLHTSL